MTDPKGWPDKPFEAPAACGITEASEWKGVAADIKGIPEEGWLGARVVKRTGGFETLAAGSMLGRRAEQRGGGTSTGKKTVMGTGISVQGLQ